MDKVAVVTISETFPAHDCKVSLRCFASSGKAERWIEGQIDEKVSEYNLDRNAAVDGWLVMADGWNHTFQYDTRELDVE